MAHGWEDRFKDLLAEILRVKYELSEVTKVTWYEEESYETGYCETCSYKVHELTVGYQVEDGSTHTFNMEGKMSDFFYDPTE